MANIDRDDLDKRILTYLKAKGTTNTFRVSQHFKIKWETADRALKRLQAQAKVFYHPDMKLWSIWADYQLTRHIDVGQQSENVEISTEGTTPMFVDFPLLTSIVRGDVAQTVEEQGFVCHPTTKAEDVSRKFVRGHLNGVYSVEILKEGRMPNTYADSDLGYKGIWYERKMTKNYGYFGELTLPEDPKVYKFHALARKDGTLKVLNVYVHPRYIFYKDNAATASSEFLQQVSDVLSVLKRYGWAFGKAKQGGTYHMALNDSFLPSRVPVDYTEKSTDILHFDSSVKDGKDGFCTEAEIYDDHSGAREEVDFYVELPQRFQRLEERVDRIENTLNNLIGVVERLVDANERTGQAVETIANAVELVAKQTELNTSILLGNIPKTDDETKKEYVAKPNKKGDVMYV